MTGTSAARLTRLPLKRHAREAEEIGLPFGQVPSVVVGGHRVVVDDDAAFVAVALQDRGQRGETGMELAVASGPVNEGDFHNFEP
jgi:hypothetical protein